MIKIINLALNLFMMIAAAFFIGIVPESISAQCDFIPANKTESPVSAANTLGGTVQNRGHRHPKHALS